MSLLKDVINELSIGAPPFAMDPRDYGIPALPRTVAKIAKGEPAELGFTTYMKQVAQSEEEEGPSDNSANPFDPDPVVNSCIDAMYGRRSDEAYAYLFDSVLAKQLTREQFVKVASYYARE